MAEISPLRGVRFNRARSGPIGPLLAPPYDVARVPENGAELSISQIENVELGVAGDQHAHAARQYRDWLAGGVLAVDRAPGIYIHRHQFPINGTQTQRTGVIARVRLHDWDDRIVLPHERTNVGPKEERRERLRNVGANLSPLYFLYRDPAEEVRTVLEGHLSGSDAITEHDRVGGRHQLEQIADPVLVGEVARSFANRSLFVADGHHRYEAALEYRDEMRQAHPGQDGPWEYVLALLAAVEDPGVQVWPTHRVLRRDSSLSPSLILEILNRWFELRHMDRGGQSAGEEVLFRLILPGTPEPFVATSREGAPHLALVAGNRGAAWRSLGVVAVEGILEAVLGARATAGQGQIAAVIDERSAIQQVVDGEASAAFLLPAPSVDRILEVAELGDLLPPKSTWFEPKAPAGLVINDLALSAPQPE